MAPDLDLKKKNRITTLDKLGLYENFLWEKKDSERQRQERNRQ